ncbi:hypothetical protein Q3G72_015741 [Acer saccharum]|nr:hypothetical protein Q3G72_015741 [Acer saccharum]
MTLSRADLAHELLSPIPIIIPNGRGDTRTRSLARIPFPHIASALRNQLFLILGPCQLLKEWIIGLTTKVYALPCPPSDLIPVVEHKRSHSGRLLYLLKILCRPPKVLSVFWHLPSWIKVNTNGLAKGNPGLCWSCWNAICLECDSMSAIACLKNPDPSLELVMVQMLC